jgi:hypothetical protein
VILITAMCCYWNQDKSECRVNEVEGYNECEGNIMKCKYIKV